jgi:hypothetical protein
MVHCFWAGVLCGSPDPCFAFFLECRYRAPTESVSVCDVTGSVILSDRYRGVTVPSCEIKRRGFSGTKGFCSR